MNTPQEQPLELAGRMMRRSRQLFRELAHPGYAYLPDIADEAVTKARGMARASAAEDESAAATLDDVLRDGRVTPREIRRLRLARAQVRRSARLDKQLAAGGVA